MEDKEIQLEESQILADEKSGTIVIKLYEKDGSRNIALVGSPELMLAAGMEVMGLEAKPAVMPHDTMLAMGKALDAVLYKVTIYDLDEGRLKARLHFVTADNEERAVEIDPNTGLALALKGQMYLTIRESVLVRSMDERRHKVHWYDMDDHFVSGLLNETPDEVYESSSSDDLQRYLDKAVQLEDYALAARLREIMKRKQRGE